SVGAVVQGVLGDRFGLRVVTAGCALGFAGLVLVLGLLRPDLASAFDDPELSPAGAPAPPPAV
ncbi:MAG: MFS transporter, partial [Acidimicrobiia bacterium]|nr:MFS transporter [Acidimicrobiia bacterium]